MLGDCARAPSRDHVPACSSKKLVREYRDNSLRHRCTEVGGTSIRAMRPMVTAQELRNGVTVTGTIGNDTMDQFVDNGPGTIAGLTGTAGTIASGNFI
jgi:hypothetical protein